MPTSSGGSWTKAKRSGVPANALLRLDPATHRYSLGGNGVAGVTETIRPLAPDFDRFPSLEARQRGTDVHAITAAGDAGGDHFPCGLSDERVDDLWPYVHAWGRFLRESGAVVDQEYIERRVYHPVYRYAGTIDRVVALNGTNLVLDIKTGTYDHSHVLQLAAYREALLCEGYVDGPILGAISVYLQPHGYTTRSYRPTQLRGALTTFLALRTVAEWKAEHGTVEPPDVQDDWVPLDPNEIFQL